MPGWPGQIPGPRGRSKMNIQEALSRDARPPRPRNPRGLVAAPPDVQGELARVAGLAPGRAPAKCHPDGPRPRRDGARARGLVRTLHAAGPQGRSDAHPFPPLGRRAGGRAALGGPTGPRPLPPGDDVLRLGGGAGHVRDDRPDPRPAGRSRPGARLRALREGLRHGDGRAAAARESLVGIASAASCDLGDRCASRAAAGGDLPFCGRANSG